MLQLETNLRRLLLLAGAILIVISTLKVTATEIDILPNVESILQIANNDARKESNVPEKLNQIGNFLSIYEYEKALVGIKQLREQEPKNHAFCYLQSVSNIGLKKWQEANLIVDDCIRLNNKWPVSYTLKGSILAVLDKMAEARQLYNYAIALAPQNPGGYLQRAKFLYYYQNHDKSSLQRAQLDIEQYLALGGNANQSNGTLGLIYAATNRPQLAQKYLSKELTIHPGNFRILNALLVAAYQQNQVEQAQSYLRDTGEYLSSTSASAQAQSQLAWLRAKHAIVINDAKQTEHYFEQALEAQADNLDVRKAYIHWLDKQERLSETISLSKQGLKLSPDDSYFISYLAWALTDEGKDFEVANMWLNKAKNINPDSAYLADTQAWWEARQGNYEQALQYIQLSLPHASTSPEIAYHAGYIFHKLGNTQKAVDYLQLSLSSNSSFTGRSAAKTLLAQLRQ